MCFLDEINIYIGRLCVKQVASILWACLIQSAESFDRMKTDFSQAGRDWASRLLWTQTATLSRVFGLPAYPAVFWTSKGVARMIVCVYTYIQSISSAALSSPENPDICP